jgi:hypothetical protein
MNRKYLTIIEFIPIMAFGWVVRLTSENGVNWKLAFIIGACLAVIEKAFLLAKSFPVNRIFLGVDVFLIIGGAGFLFNIQLILNIYGRLIQATLFASILAVGVLATFLTERGFIGIKHHDRKRVLIYSLYLLGACVAAFIVALLFRGNNFIAGVLPFTGMLVASNLLTKKLRDTTTKPHVKP